MANWTFYIKIATLAALAAVAHLTAHAKPAPVAELSIKIVDNRTHILFTGPDIFGGPGNDLTFLLDTGTTTSVFFDRSFIPDSALTDNEAQVNFPAIGHIVTGKRLGNVPLGSGDAMFVSSNGLLIMGETDVKEALDANFSGIIGQELFRRFVVEIDPQEGKMRLYPPGSDLTEEFEIRHRLRMSGHTPYIVFKSRLPWEKRITKKRMMLDSGYPGGLVFWSKRHFMLVASPNERRELAEKNMGIMTAANIKFGNLNFENLPVFIASNVPQQSESRDGLIGASILAQYRHVIDFQAQRLLLSPLLDERGKPVQIIDGAVYTPNNEDFLVKFFEPKVPIHPILTLYLSRERPLATHQ